MYTQYNVYIYDYNNVFVLCHDTTSEFNQIPYTVHKFQNKTTKKIFWTFSSNMHKNLLMMV